MPDSSKLNHSAYRLCFLFIKSNKDQKRILHWAYLIFIILSLYLYFHYTHGGEGAGGGRGNGPSIIYHPVNFYCLLLCLNFQVKPCVVFFITLYYIWIKKDLHCSFVIFIPSILPFHIILNFLFLFIIAMFCQYVLLY